jgi:hypothetical protein
VQLSHLVDRPLRRSEVPEVELIRLLSLLEIYAIAENCPGEHHIGAAPRILALMYHIKR